MTRQGGVIGHHARALASPANPLVDCDMWQECEAKAFVILMSGRPERMIVNACGFWGEDVVGVGVGLTGHVSQRGWQTGRLWEWVTKAIRGHRGAFMGLSNRWPPTILCTGNVLAAEWKDHVNEEDRVWLGVSHVEGWRWTRVSCGWICRDGDLERNVKLLTRSSEFSKRAT